MTETRLHQFHIPVMGLGFTIDTPLKVAKYGISSVLSIVEDHLIEHMRSIHSKKFGYEYEEIDTKQEDYRAKRITAYLNLLNDIVNHQVEVLRQEPFEDGNDIMKYFHLLPDDSKLKGEFFRMLDLVGDYKIEAQDRLRRAIRPGSIDVNIMTKLDKQNYNRNEPLPQKFNDAHAALRGFAQSKVDASLILSAGMNPRLFGYMEEFDDFNPSIDGYIKKRIILKVSDYRSSLIQGKFLAKKGIWISEFRVESGLNCGGHAFATDGLLMGPILEEFSDKRAELLDELKEIYYKALEAKGVQIPNDIPEQIITVQGGIGTHEEHEFLTKHYKMDATGWGSPFLLVPEVTNVETKTLQQLASAKKEDYYLSDASPLGVPFNNFRGTSSQELLQKRMDEGKPGSPCHKKFLQLNTTYTKKPICTASRRYFRSLEEELKEKYTDPAIIQAELDKANQKDCLCEGLGASSIIVNNETPANGLDAVAVCPGPNLAYFSGIYSMKEMIDHIYGRFDALNHRYRSHMFINELHLYVDFYKKELNKAVDQMNKKQEKYFTNFRSNLLKGIEYYQNMIPDLSKKKEELMDKMNQELDEIKAKVEQMSIMQMNQA